MLQNVDDGIKKSYRNTVGPRHIWPQSSHSQVTLDLRVQALKSGETGELALSSPMRLESDHSQV